MQGDELVYDSGRLARLALGGVAAHGGVAHLAATGGIGPDCRLETEAGEVAAGQLCAGDRLLLREGDVRVLRDVLLVERAGTDPAGAIRIPQGALGPDLPARDLVLAADQSILVAGPRVDLLTGEREALIAAGLLPGRVPGCLRIAAPTVLVRLVLDTPEIACIEGLWAEAAPPAAAEPAAGVVRLDARGAAALFGR
jgi:hypothetical protein